MRDLLIAGKPATEDLSSRMADNVVEAVVTYMQAPGMATAEQAQVLSAALQSLATLAVAEQLQRLNGMLATEDGYVLDGDGAL